MSDVRSETASETSDVPPALLAGLAGGLALAIAIVIGGVAIGFPSVLSPAPRGPLQALPPAPQLQSDPRGDLERYDQLQMHRLANYGWTPDGHVRVPIDQAMDEVAANGWSSGQ